MNELGQIDNSALDSLSTRNRTKELPKDNELGQDAFLQLLVTQLSNQDPLSPQENGEFIAQLAQFSSVEGIQSLNTSVEDMATSLRSNQALQASALVGRSVRLPTNSVHLAESGGVHGGATLPVSSQQVSLRVYDSGGQLVNEALLSQSSGGLVEAGEVPINWDGTNQEGQRLDSGTYRIEASALVNGEPQGLETHFNSNVNSVTLGQGADVTLNVTGVGPILLSEVTEIF